jgi:endonuclease III
MIDEEKRTKITQELLRYGEKVANEELFPTVVPEAAPLIASDPYAFLIATCLDRGTKAEIIWTIPYYTKQELGHLDPKLIYKMTLDDLKNLFARLPKKPHYINAAPRTVQELTRIVVEKYNGNAAKLWESRDAWEVESILESIYGVGEGIANMGILLIEKAFSIEFSDKSFMDIKADTHTMRVLYRLGVSESLDERSAMRTARRMNPTFPGELDNPLWAIGRNWCHAIEPDCLNCVMREVCAKRF